MNLRDLIRTIPDYPKPGIMFRDITTLLGHAEGFKHAIQILVDRYAECDFDYVAGIEARGFILGAPIAASLGKGFIPVRKVGKLPGKTLTQSYALEYGTDEIEIHVDAFPSGSKILLVDDLIATGGTAEAAAKLIEISGGKVAGFIFVINLFDLPGNQLLKSKGYKTESLIEFPGH